MMRALRAPSLISFSVSNMNESKLFRNVIRIGMVHQPTLQVFDFFTNAFVIHQIDI